MQVCRTLADRLMIAGLCLVSAAPRLELSGCGAQPHPGPL